MRPIRSPWLFVSGYVLLIGLGTALLSLPGATTTPSSLFELFFTATSAVCLVGLTVVDTAHHFTPLGQTVILLLVQLGALFYLFFSVSFVRQVITPSDEHSSPKRVWWRVVIITLVVEVGTCLLVFYAWGNYPFESVGHKIFTTVFHAVSAFCNAGFSLLTIICSLYSGRSSFTWLS